MPNFNWAMVKTQIRQFEGYFMRLLKTLCVCLVALLTGCSVSPGLYQYYNVSPADHNQHMKIYPIYIDKSFDEKELATVVKVINEWNYVLNGYMRLEIEKEFIDHTDADSMNAVVSKIKETHEGIIIVGVNHDDEIVSDEIEESDGVLAFVDNLGDRAHFMAVLRDRIGHRNLHKIILHEFGHAFGARHVEAVSLMYPYIGANQSDCVDKITALQTANHYGLDINHLNYCVTPNLK